MVSFKYLLVFFAVVVAVNGIQFELPMNQEKCLKEETHKDILVKGDYTISEMGGITVDLKVK